LEIQLIRDLILSKFDNIVFADEIHPNQSFGLGPISDHNIWIGVLKEFDFKKKYILFDSFVEGYFPVEHIERLHKEIRQNNYPPRKIIWITSNLAVKKCYIDWKDNSKYKDDESINVIGSFFWLNTLIDDFPQKDSCIINTETRDKLFLFLNNKKHPLRASFFKEIKDMGGLDISAHSFIEKDIFLPDRHNQIRDRWNLNNMAAWPGWGLKNLNQHYENTYFETWCSCDEDEIDGRIFMCDKMVKPLVQGQPFIGLFNPFTLKSLRELGFETFPELFDESYDDEVNIDNRFNMVVKEIKRYVDLWNRDKEEVHNIFSQDIVLEKRIHNRNRSFNNNIVNSILDQLGDIV
jgi:hypothetical protein